MAAGCAAMAEEGQSEHPKFPFPLTDEQRDTILDLRDKLGKELELKCKAISMTSLISFPEKGVKLHSCRAVANNFMLLDLVVPYLNKSLVIKRVHALQWILETVVILKWKAGAGIAGLAVGCQSQSGVQHNFTKYNQKKALYS